MIDEIPAAVVSARAHDAVNLDAIFEQGVVKGHPAADYGWKGIVAKNDVMTPPRQLHGDGRGRPLARQWVLALGLAMNHIGRGPSSVGRP